jgi:hypothetical protein
MRILCRFCVKGPKFVRIRLEERFPNAVKNNEGSYAQIKKFITRQLQKINLHKHIFRKALYSTSVRGPSDMWFWIYLLYPTPVFTPICLEEP